MFPARPRAEEVVAARQPSREASPRGYGWNILVARPDAATLTISLIGDHDEHAAATFVRIGESELAHCERIIADFRSTGNLAVEVVDGLIELVDQAKMQGVAVELATEAETYAHDVLEVFGILHLLDRTDNLP